MWRVRWKREEKERLRNYEGEGREGHRPRIGAVLLLVSCGPFLSVL